jgi:hypothetical protein
VTDKCNTDDRPTIDRDALRAEGGDIREWVERDLDLLDPRKATPSMVADLIAMVRDRQHRLDAETRRADTAEARIASLETWQHIANARIVNTEAERDALAERIAAAIEAAHRTAPDCCAFVTAARIARETT